MVETGLEAYRFSISWSRLLPSIILNTNPSILYIYQHFSKSLCFSSDGRGAVNPKGLQYYNNLINQLISNGYT